MAPELGRKHQTGRRELANCRASAEPVILGQPCRDHPPSVVVSVSGGGRRVIIGGQLALDSDGNIVGKGDMRAQIEQVGKNVQACLKAAGANASDIILTRAYVTDADAFKKNADMLATLSRPRIANQHYGQGRPPGRS